MTHNPTATRDPQAHTPGPLCGTQFVRLHPHMCPAGKAGTFNPHERRHPRTQPHISTIHGRVRPPKHPPLDSNRAALTVLIRAALHSRLRLVVFNTTRAHTDNGA